MTIFYRETFPRTFFRKRIKSNIRTLGPEQEFVFTRNIWDEDGRGEYEDEVWLKGKTPDSLEYRVLSRRHLPPTGLWLPDPTDEDIQRSSYKILERERITSHVVVADWGGRAHGKKGQEIDVWWEEGLHTQAKK